MTKEPKLPHKLKWGDRTAARVDEVGYLIGIRIVGYTTIRAVGRPAIRDVIIAEVHESVADEVRAWSLPEDLKSIVGADVESARRLKEHSRRRRVYGEAASRGVLQVYKA